MISEETRKKLSEAQRGNTKWLGKHHSEATKIKMRESKLGKHRSDETKKKISKSKLGIHPSEESKKKMSEAKRGQKNSNFGKSFSMETRRKLSEAHKGEKSYLWKGGISKEEYSEKWTDILKESIRCRDHYTCRLCGEKQGNISHPVHHIDYNKKHCDPKNLITVCHCCHIRTNFNREYWIECFRKLDIVFDSEIQEAR